MQSQEINTVMQASATAFEAYRKLPAIHRAVFIDAIAEGLENAGDALLELASSETNLPIPRLRGEMGRTCFQLRMYAKEIRNGHWVEAIIDHAMSDKNPPAPDIRRMRIPLGPIVVFGASNFPFAYSTAGGDTASALAAGCSVVIKQHPAHAATSNRVFEIIHQAIETTDMPACVVQHVEDKGFATGQGLVQHPAAAAVGFTGSFTGGTALVNYANERKHPIPVFAEMGSTNPVLLFPGALTEDAKGIAEKYAVSITLGMGQFCTNPGLLLAIDTPALQDFEQALSHAINEIALAEMLHDGIAKNYLTKTREALAQKGVTLVSEANANADAEKPVAYIARIGAHDFLENPLVHEEIFGPWSLLVVCKDSGEMLSCRNAVAGQLTTSIMANDDDLNACSQLIDSAVYNAGRVVFNSVPTGVEVCSAMVHGGPHPACTDSRFSAVGPFAIQRWTRPVCWQNAPSQMLPFELQEENPLGIRRLVDGKMVL